MKTGSNHTRQLIRGFCLCGAGAILIYLTGCATTGSIYQATATSTNDAAVVSGTLKPFIWLRKATLQSVDGVPVGFWQAQSTSPILIDPGPRALFVRGQYVRFWSHGDAYAELKATLKAGHTYQIKVELQKQSMTFWVEDLANHEAVCNPQTSQASWIINAGGI